MRWFLPLLSLAFVSPALAERAVYTGSLKAQNLANPGASNVVRVAEVIDLETGGIVTVALTGTKLNFAFTVGAEVQSVIAKAIDAKKHATTAIAQAAAATDPSGSKFALSTVLRGTDVTVTLGDAGTSRWPRTLSGSGSLVAAAGADATAAPGGISLSTIALALSEPYSKLANSSGGTLEQCAEVVGQAYRDAVAKSLKYPVSHGTASTGGSVSAPTGDVVTGGNSGSSEGVSLYVSGANISFGPTGYFYPAANGALVKTGAGNLTLTAPVFTPPQFSLGAVAGVSNVIRSSSSASFTSGGSLTIGSGSLDIRTPDNLALTKVGSGTLTLGAASTISLSGINTYIGAVSVNKGTLVLASGTLSDSTNLTGAGNLAITSVPSSAVATQLSGWTAVNPTTGASMTIGSSDFNGFLTTGQFVGSIASHTLTFRLNPTTIALAPAAVPVADPAPAAAAE